jgi:phosphatidate cytidylyltransferase
MRTRIISAVIALLVILPIYYYGGVAFYLFALAMGIIAIREMIKLREEHKAIPFGVRTMTYLFAVFIMFNQVNINGFQIVFSTALLGMTLFTFFIPMVLYKDIQKYSINDAAFLFISIIYVALPFNAAIHLRESSIHFLTIAIIISVATDTFAYFTGYFIGRHKLIPEISPKKTIEGAIGGIVFSVLFVVLYIVFFNTGLEIYQGIIITLVLSPLGQVGDLVASAIKRRYKIKDFGNLMPGHGGVLDRFDNLMFVILGLNIILDILNKIS